MKNNEAPKTARTLDKSPTGIRGLDEITGGGLPKGRPTLVCGNAGCGKTLFAMEFIVRGATEFGEPGVFIAFEENEKELSENVASLGFDLQQLVYEKKLMIDHVHVERSEIEETGEYDLEGLFIRLKYAIDKVGAKRVVLDTIESLFSALPNQLVIRSELRRLFRWLKAQGVTAIITGEKDDGQLTRQGIEEYVSDCVILLDNRVTEQSATRRLRIVKYRGTTHGTNEYPFLIEENGFSVIPITSTGLDHQVSNERISSGVPRLDTMLDGRGYYRGSSILISGTAGIGKSSLAAHFTSACCQRGERVLYFSLEESPSQILRNMRSIGLDLEPCMKKGLIRFHSSRPTFYGLETYLNTIMKEVNSFKPASVVIDPISSFVVGNNELEAKSMMIRMIDYLKMNSITTLLTNLASGDKDGDQTFVTISSLIDTWLLLRDIESAGERNRGMYILKSRGMAHSNQIREFILTSHGAELLDVYVGPEGVLTGNSRVVQETREKAEYLLRQQEIARKRLELERKRKEMHLQLASVKSAFEAEELALHRAIEIEEERARQLSQDREEMSVNRKGDKSNVPAPGWTRQKQFKND